MSKAVMDKGLLAESKIEIDAPRDEVWEALVDPDSIKRYMFGTTVTSDWREGSPITWKGEFKGKKYEDKGVILQMKPERTLQYSHYSPMSGAPDRPESYHTVTIDLSGQGERTKVTLTQDNNATEQTREDSEKNWTMMLQSLKKLLEA
jgi:uncharacterized protein YndB with AHSA1/START domain